MDTLLSSHAELRSTQDELMNIATAVSRIQGRLTNIIRRSEDEARSVQDRITELENEGQDMSRELNGLWELNQELQQEASRSNPEVERAVDARNAALRKLNRSRKVIRDLLDERRAGLAAECGRLSPISGAVPPDGREAGTLDIVSLDSLLEGGSNNGKSSSHDTVRPEKVAAVNNATTDVRRNSPKVFIRQEMPDGSQTRTPGRSTNGGHRNPKQSESGSPVSARVISGAVSSSSDQAPWKIRYSRPPLSIAISRGPMSWVDLAEKLSLDDKTMKSLQSLMRFNRFGLRLQIIDELAFVYDPIILEGPSASYLVDWGREELNQAAVRYVNRGRIAKPVFHTFFFPVKKGGWYYYGVTAWTATELWSVWPTLGMKSRDKITAKLRDRCESHLEKDGIIRLIEGGFLQQMCFEISGQSNTGASRAFASKIGFK